MKVKVVHGVQGGILNDTVNVPRGQIVDWPEDYALRQLYLGNVEHPDAASQLPEERKALLDRAREAYLAHAVPMLEAAQAVHKPRGAPPAPKAPENPFWRWGR
jgi:hypothetical protein